MTDPTHLLRDLRARIRGFEAEVAELVKANAELKDGRAALAEALRAMVGYFDGDDAVHLGNALVNACNALAAHDRAKVQL